MRGLHLLFEFAMRAALLGVIGVIVSRIFWRRGPETQHAIWRMVLAGMLALPLLMAVLPSLRILPHPAKAMAVVRIPSINQTAAFGSPAPADVRDPAQFAPDRSFPVDWTIATLGIYLSVAAMMLGRVALRVRRGKRAVSSAVRVPDSLLHELVYPRPELRESADTFVPFTVGLRDPVVVLPANWREWDVFKLRSVLAHELTHVRRGDWTTSLAAAINCAVFWFHPLAWWLERRLAVLAEEACDVSAIHSAGDPARYAKVVLEFAEIASMQQRAGAKLMAHSSKVGRRIKGILEGRVRWSPGISTLARISMLIVGAPALYLAASLQPAGQEPAAALKKSPPSPYAAMPRGEAYRAVLSDGWKINPTDAAALESELERNPENLSARIRLVSYYTQYMVLFNQRTTHLHWLIEHHPDCDIFQLGSVVTSVFSDYTGLNTPGDAEHAKALWLRQTERFATNPAVLTNAANAFAGSDSRLALEFIKRAYALEPGNPEWLDWLGEVYATVIRSSFASAPPRVRAAGPVGKLHGGFSLPPLETVQAKRELEASSDAALLAATGDALLQETSLLKRFGHGDPEIQASEDYGTQLLSRARQLDPNNSRWK